MWRALLYLLTDRRNARTRLALAQNWSSTSGRTVLLETSNAVNKLRFHRFCTTSPRCLSVAGRLSSRSSHFARSVESRTVLFDYSRIPPLLSETRSSQAHTGFVVSIWAFNPIQPWHVIFIILFSSSKKTVWHIFYKCISIYTYHQRNMNNIAMLSYKNARENIIKHKPKISRRIIRP